MDKHKEIVHWLFEEVWSNESFGEVITFIAPQVEFHYRGQTWMETPENLIYLVKHWKTAFPDLQFEVHEIIVEGDLAAARLVYQGTHQGEWGGIPPTGRKIRVDEMIFLRFEENRIAAVWEIQDEHALRQQLTKSND